MLSYPIPTMVNIPDVREISDVAAMKNISIVKSSEDGLIYIWGRWANAQINIHVICECTNIIDICNTMVGQSPISMDHVYTDTGILSNLAKIFNDYSTSDLKIEIKDQFIWAHKAILKIRSIYFRQRFRTDIKKNQRVISCHDYSYTVYEAFLKYLYTDEIEQLPIDNLLDLLKLADGYHEKDLERDCIWMIKEEITASNVLRVKDVTAQYNNKELEEYCFKFLKKNMTTVMADKNFKDLDLNTKRELLRLCY